MVFLALIALSVVLVAVWLLRRALKLFLWFAVALVVGVGVPGAVLGVLFLILRAGGAH